jgi:RHS repeat-associated protein
MEVDDEVKGKGNSYDFGARMLDPRIGRWLSTDNIIHHNINPYSGFDNNPLYYGDVEGDNAIGKIKYNKDGSIKKITVKAVINFYGGGSSKEISKEIASDIQTNLNTNETVYFDPVTRKTVPINYKVKGKNISNIGARVRIFGNKIFGGMKQNFIRIEDAEELKDAVKSNEEGGTQTTMAFMISYANNAPDKNIEAGGNSGFFTLEAVYGDSKEPLTSTHEFVHGMGYRNPENTNDYGHSTDASDLMVGSGGSFDQNSFSQNNLQLLNSSGPIAISEQKTRFVIGSSDKKRTLFVKKDGKF